MAQYQEGNHVNFKAVSDLTAKQFYIVKASSTENEIALAAAATDKLIGVLTNKPLSGETADVYARNAAGTGKVIAGGTVAINDYITSDANGKAVATTTSGDQILGIALEAAVSGDIFKYLPYCGKY
jgi:hypothetical protein